jgi:hypothetical protein
VVRSGALSLPLRAAAGTRWLRRLLSQPPICDQRGHRGYGGALVGRSTGAAGSVGHGRVADVITDHIDCPAHAYGRDDHPSMVLAVAGPELRSAAAMR